MEQDKVVSKSRSTLLDKRGLLLEGSALGVFVADAEGLDCKLLPDFLLGNLRPLVVVF